MSQFHNVFCRSGVAVDSGELGDIVGNAWYGDEQPTLEFQPPGAREAGGDWEKCDVMLPGSKRPIVIQRDTAEAAVSTMVEEVLREPRIGSNTSVADHLTATRQIFGLEIFPEHMDDDAWELLDVVQSYLARQRDGIVVTDDGVYDRDLTRLLDL